MPPRVGESKTSPRRIKAWERHREALELRKKGLSYQKIADELGYAGPQGAYEAVMAALRKTLQEPADEVRRLEMARLDEMWEALWERRGNPRVLDRLLKVMERRARLLGLDAPSKTQVSGNPDAPVEHKVKHEYSDDQVADILSVLAETGTLDAKTEDSGDPETERIHPA